MAQTYIAQLNQQFLNGNDFVEIGRQDSGKWTTINSGISGRRITWNDYEVENKIDSSNRQIEAERQAQEKKKYQDAEAQYNLYQQRLKTERQALLNKNGALTPEEQDKLKTYNDSMKLNFKDLSKDKQLGYSGLGLIADPATPNPIAPPVRSTEQPWATPVAWQQGNGGGAYVPPVKNAVNQYTFQDGHKEFDSTAIPEVLQKGKITPARYFAMNGMNFIRDAKKLATEMGMTNYRGTPGENYALVNFMEEKKNGNPTAGGEQNRGSNRKFDGIQSDVLPNRFTQEERDRVMAMTPEEQAKYVSERNVADLKKMLPGNVGLINKVFGTNYTSDDLTGGIGRATIMGTGMTAKGMEVQKLIEGLNEGTANKFMSKWAELDNSVKDNERMNTWSVQSGRRKLLEDMVDGRTPMWQGTTIDDSDKEYMEAYKIDKRVQSNTNTYNELISAWNNTAPWNVGRNKILVEIQKKVNDLSRNDPEVYAQLKDWLDKIPEFISKWWTGKLPSITAKRSDIITNNWTETSSKKNIEITPANNNNIPDATTGVYTKENAENAKINPDNLDPVERKKFLAKKKWIILTNEQAQAEINKEIATWEEQEETKPIATNPLSVQQKSWSSYYNNERTTSIWYSSNINAQW